MHIYREISSAQVSSSPPTTTTKTTTTTPHQQQVIHVQHQPPTTRVLPAVPTRTSSLHMTTDKTRPTGTNSSSKVPMDLYERYLKSAYNPNSDPWISSLNVSSNSPPKENTKVSRGFGDFYGGTLRDSLRKLSGRGSSNTTNKANMIQVNIPPEILDLPTTTSQTRPTYAVRSRSNSFKENNNGWINVGPELAIKPAASNVQPVINVTIVHGGGQQEKARQSPSSNGKTIFALRASEPTIPEPDYNSAEKISGNGSLTVHSPGNLRPAPAPNNGQYSTFSRTRPGNPAGYRGSFREAPTAGRYHVPVEQYSSSSALLPSSAVSSPVQEKSSRFSTLLGRRSTSLSRAPLQAAMAHAPSAVSAVRRPLSPELKPVLKKRPQSQNGREGKKNVTFSEYTLVYS